MRVVVMNECGHLEALFGNGLSYGVTNMDHVTLVMNREFEFSTTWTKMNNRAQLLAGKGGGHDKFLRQIMVWMFIKAPFFWWKQFDQYKVGTTTTSESTMHTLMKRNLTQSDFEEPISQETLDRLNVYIACGDFDTLVNELPSGFLQGRLWTGSYANLLNVVQQRTGHKLGCWFYFINSLKMQLEHPELIFDMEKPLI